MFTQIMQNKHTTGAGLFILTLVAACQIAGIFAPSLEGKFEKAASKLELLAVSYGLFMGADSQKKNAQDQTTTPDKNENNK